MGFGDKTEAEQAYMDNYEEGWDGFGGITEMNLESFKTWLGDGKRKKDPLYDSSRSDTSINDDAPGRIIKKDDFGITLDLNQGPASASVLTCDFSVDYVKINADYRT